MLARTCASYVCFRPTEDISPKKHRLAAFLVGTSAVQSELTTMTDQSDLRDKRDDKFYISWIIRGGIVLALVVAVLAFISTGYPTIVPASVF